ncbi:hypothetical protein PP1Y_AT23986 [Novosphingobium sp. PP1Y]|nr:hypothetical protein PP1Y_AT23986 [Novosphingobium sp. PP1Y]
MMEPKDGQALDIFLWPSLLLGSLRVAVSQLLLQTQASTDETHLNIAGPSAR